MKKHRHIVFGALLLLLLNHFMMATFDDYASRHTLIAVLSFAIFVAPLLDNTFGRLLCTLLCFVHIFYVFDFRNRWYAEPERFNQFLTEKYPMLPTNSIEEARTMGCAWISEEDGFAADPVRSHFNLLDPTEFEAMMLEHSCVDWCLSVQDWRWSSLGVADRTYRIKAMYSLTPKAIVQVGDQSCLQLRIGKRRIAIK